VVKATLPSVLLGVKGKIQLFKPEFCYSGSEILEAHPKLSVGPLVFCHSAVALWGETIWPTLRTTGLNCLQKHYTCLGLLLV
jgi:hypothetical protein